jgi:HAD superfamily hydrolase (TIGR01549 family)
VLEAVLFDLDGTLYRQEPLRRAMLWRLVRAHVRRPFGGYRTARILGAYRRAQEHLRDAAMRSDDLAAAQLEWVCQRTGTSPATVADCVSRWMEQEPLKIIARYTQPGLIDFLSSCKQRGLRLGLLSDYPAEAKLRALKLESAFDVVLSAQSPSVGAFKPDPRGLLALAKQLEVHPANSVYIGDRAEVDAAAAKAAGMSCFILTSRAERGHGSWTAVRSYAELSVAISMYLAEPVGAAQPSLDLR